VVYVLYIEIIMCTDNTIALDHVDRTFQC